MDNVKEKSPFENGGLVDGKTEEEWRELGSAEANAWTITPPGGGQPVSLSEHAAQQAVVMTETENNARLMREQMAEEEVDRQAMQGMSNPERVAYLNAKYPDVDHANPLGA